MKLKGVYISKFRNFLDTGEVPIEPDITCLVGKNEAGKTAFLHAVYRLKPARPNVQFSILEHYPAWIEKKDERNGIDPNQVAPITCTYELEDSDIKKLEERFGAGVIKSKQLTCQRRYDSKITCDIGLDEKLIVKRILDAIDMSPDTKKMLSESSTIADLNNAIDNFASSQQHINSDVNGTESTTNNQQKEISVKKLKEHLNTFLGGKTLSDTMTETIYPLLPIFIYFAEYSELPYSCEIQRILSADPKTLNDSELTARALLRLASAEDDYLLNPDYERRKRELENIANSLTADVVKYWSQNRELRVQPDISQKTVTNPQGSQSVLAELKLRIWDQRHFLSLPFSEHSSGFKWFFSFLAAFSEYEKSEQAPIILLDEPALNLHARAQSDFLRFIEERLAPKCQVIYTTHSPFMIQSGLLNRARLIEDHGQDKGAEASIDVLSTDPDTLFPLQGALGYDIAQNLFIAPNNLVVEGTSDFTYLDVISRHLSSIGSKKSLHVAWTIIPVGGADLIPTFIALLHQHLNIAVLVDARKGGHQKLSKLAADGYIANTNIVTIGQILNHDQANIEDLFHPQDYLDLYNDAFSKELTISDLSGSDSIVKQIARADDIAEFDHGKPADYLLRNRDTILPKLKKETTTNFAALFEKFNSILASFDNP